MFWKQATHLPGFIINQSLLDKFRQTKKHQCPKLWTVLPLSSLCVRGRQQNSFFYWKFMDANSRVALAQCYSYSVLLSLGLWWSLCSRQRLWTLPWEKKSSHGPAQFKSHASEKLYLVCNLPMQPAYTTLMVISVKHILSYHSSAQNPSMPLLHPIQLSIKVYI